LKIQEIIGSDIMMSLYECSPYPSSHQYALESLKRTIRWLERSKKAKEKSKSSIIWNNSRFQLTKI
jgi:Queuine/archaeosine tRNA-ribosyltransferase